jgi:hypothetical protein
VTSTAWTTDNSIVGSARVEQQLKRAYVTLVIVKGVIVHCEINGLVKIVGQSDGPIPWPLSAHGLIIYKGLATAIRIDSPDAVARAWGVSGATVWAWKRTIGDKPKVNLRVQRGRTQRKWTAGEDKIIRDCHPGEAARRLKLSYWGVWKRRKRLGLTAVRTGRPTVRAGITIERPAATWSQPEDSFVTTLPSIDAMLRTGRTLDELRQRSHTLKPRTV